MAKQQRDEAGKFGSKGSAHREVRSVRLTESAWECWGQVAESRGLSRADLLELMAEDGYLLAYLEPQSSHARGGMRDQLEQAAAELAKDPAVTRNGKDTGAVRRTLAALLQRLIAAL